MLEYQTENMTAALDDRLYAFERENLLSSARRARRKVYEYVMANSDLQWFITFTLNGEKFSRSDVTTSVKKLNKYLANRVQRNGLKYVFVPELHKDGESIHFHGFVNDVLTFVPSGTYIPPSGGKPVKATTLKRRGIPIDECQEVFNVDDWGYGFSTAIHIYGDRKKASSYIAKYISKGVNNNAKICGRWYFSGGELETVQCEYTNEDFEAFEGFEIDEKYLHAKIFNG